MSDRTSAGIFAEIFQVIDEHVVDETSRRELAQRFWQMAQGYDFHPRQMDIDETLIRLGLATSGTEDGYPVAVYGDAP